MRLTITATSLTFALAAFLATGDAWCDTLTVPTEGLLAYYPFSGNAEDASSHSNHGTVNGATLTSDANGSPAHAYYFDGSNDFITIPGFDPAPGNGTIAAWVQVESYDLGYNQLNLIFGQNDNLQLGLGDSAIDADGKWVFRHRAGGFVNPSGPFPTIGRWTHVAGVWDGTEATLYLDGAEAQRVASGTLIATGGGATIGRHPFAAQNYWHGKIDDVVLYDRALNLDEIQDLASAYTVDSGLEFRLEEGQATLEWHSTPDALFQVRYSDDLINWLNDLPANFIFGPVGENRASYRTPATGLTSRFYSVERLFTQNLALGRPATAVSSYTHYTPDLAFDGDRETYWNAGGGASTGDPNWLKVDLGVVRTIGKVFLWYPYSGGAYNGYENHYILYGSTDDSVYTEIASGTLYDSPDYEERSDTIVLPEEARDFRYLRYDAVGGRHWSSLMELEVYPPLD